MENRGNKLVVFEARSYCDRLKRCRTETETETETETTGVKGDLISGLADDLLVDVLTRLSLKEAAKTSTLSKRWRYLWLSRPTLDLESIRTGMCPDELHENINTILGQYDCPKLRELRINGNVSGPRYLFPRHLFGANWANSLRHISLSFVVLYNRVFDTILTSCCHLESFILMYSAGPLHAKNTTPHQNLKLVSFYCCDYLEMVELWAPNLLSFSYHGEHRSICLKDCKQLLTLRLTSLHWFEPHPSLVCPKVFVGQFSSYFRKVESLTIGGNLFEDRNEFAEELYLLPSLKQLALDVVMPSLAPLVYELAASILRVAPYLQMLEINLPKWMDVRSSWRKESLEFGTMRLHQNLVELKFTGFRGDSYTMDFVSYILENVASLQKINVTAHQFCREGESHYPISTSLDWQEDEAEICKELARQLRQKLPTNASLFFLDICI